MKVLWRDVIEEIVLALKMSQWFLCLKAFNDLNLVSSDS
jgi:hypothetical protein